LTNEIKINETPNVVPFKPKIVSEDTAPTEPHVPYVRDFEFYFKEGNVVQSKVVRGEIGFNMPFIVVAEGGKNKFWMLLEQLIYVEDVTPEAAA